MSSTKCDIKTSTAQSTIPHSKTELVEHKDIDCSQSLGIHTLDLHNECPGIEELLRKAPQQVKKRQVEQQGDLLGNIYNLGSGVRSVSYEEAAEQMLRRTYPDLERGKQKKPIFIPEIFIPRVPMAVDHSNYNVQFEKLTDEEKKQFNMKDLSKELDGDMVEKKLYEEVKEFYKDVEVTVLHGAELLLPMGKKGHKQESDIIVINKEKKYILNIEAKLTLSNIRTNTKRGSSIDSATKQLSTTKDILEKYFCKNISSSWFFIGVIYYKHLEENINFCLDCNPFIIKTEEIDRTS